MKFPFAPTIIALLLTSFIGLAPAQHRHHDDDRVYFDNRTSSMLSIYKAPLSSRSRPVRNLESGDIVALPSGAGVQWVVATPVWYRLVSSILTSERGSNRLVIRDSELRAIGGTAVTTSFTNRSGVPVKVRIVVNGEELDWLWISNGRASSTASFARQDWVIRDQASGKLLQRATTENGATSIQINPPRAGRSDHHRGHQHEVAPVELTITNTTAHTINIYRKTAFGSRKVGSIAPRRSATIETEGGEVWRVEDAVTLEVLETIVVPEDDQHCKVSVNSKPSRPSRSEPQMVKVNFHNDSNAIIYIYKQKDGKWKYTKRIYPDREYQLEFTVGQAISIRDPKSGDELESLKAPSRDTTMHIKPHGDHAHAESDSGDNHEAPARSAETETESVRPRDILRRILRGK